MIDKILITAICMIAGISIAMQLLLLSLPYLKKIEFDAVCHRYVMTMTVEGEPGERNHQSLAGKLEDRGFEVRRLDVEGGTAYGDLMSLDIDVAWKTSRLSQLISIEEVEWCFTYSAKVPLKILLEP